MSRRDEFEETWDDWGDDVESDDPAASGRRRKQRPLILQTLYEDEDLVVVNKPAGIPTGVEDEPRQANGPDSVLEQLACRLTVREEELAVLEHVNSGVSGVLLIARSGPARRELPRQFARHEIEKTYLAIVRGAPLQTSGAIDLEIGPDKAGPARMRVGGSHARPAHTDWTLRDRYAGIALVECRTRRERIDQVRLHLQAAGMPLAVDPEYGGESALMLSSFKPDYRPSRRHGERPLIGRVSLHALSLEFVHPRSGAKYRIEAPLPKDFRATINQLDKHGRIGVAQQ